MKIVISALHFDWQDMPGCLARATRDWGLDGVELSWHASFARPHCTQRDIDWLADNEIDAALSAHIWENLAAMEPGAAGQALRLWLDECARTGVRDLVVHGGSAERQMEGVERVRGVLQDVLPAFEETGVVLNVENHYAYDYHDCHELLSEPWELERILALDSPSLRFCFDTGHGNMTRNTRELLQAAGSRLNYVHLADNRGVDDDHLMYRRGTVDWDGILAQLRGMRFDGTFCVEFPVRDDRAPFEQCVADLRSWKRHR